MTRRTKLILAGVGAMVFLAAGLILLRVLSGTDDDQLPPVTTTSSLPGEAKVIDLYFSDGDGRRLALERREIPAGTLTEQAKNGITELISGPRKENLSPTVPKKAQVRTVFYREKVVYVDFTSSLVSGHPGGSWSELLTVYSIVNTLTENFGEIDRVQLLIEGRESETLAGHTDISRPLPGRVQLLAGDW